MQRQPLLVLSTLANVARVTDNVVAFRGALFSNSLTIPDAPNISFVDIFLCEWIAFHGTIVSAVTHVTVQALSFVAV